MNKVFLIGRLTGDPDYVKRETTNTAKYILAVDRRKKDETTKADFIRCTAFGKGADFAALYLKKGIKIAVTGHIQTGSYVNNDGQKVYTTDVIVEDQEFVESKKAQEEPETFVDVSEVENLPFN